MGLGVLSKSQIDGGEGGVGKGQEKQRELAATQERKRRRWNVENGSGENLFYSEDKGGGRYEKDGMIRMGAASATEFLSLPHISLQ